MPQCPYIAMRLNLPLWLIRIVYNGSVCVAILLSLLLSPLLLFYVLILLCLVWLRWLRRGKDVLVVFSDTPTCQERMSQILPLVDAEDVEALVLRSTTLRFLQVPWTATIHAGACSPCGFGIQWVRLAA